MQAGRPAGGQFRDDLVGMSNAAGKSGPDGFRTAKGGGFRGTDGGGIEPGVAAYRRPTKGHTRSLISYRKSAHRFWQRLIRIAVHLVGTGIDVGDVDTFVTSAREKSTCRMTTPMDPAYPVPVTTTSSAALYQVGSGAISPSATETIGFFPRRSNRR